jgi:hypothetical protein
MTREQAGSVAEEAAKLFATLNDDDRQDLRPGAECQWCPVCQLISLIRHSRPETIDQLTAAAAGVLGSLRGFLDAAAEVARARAADDHGHDDTTEDREKTEDKAEDKAEDKEKTERIDVSEDPEPWD